MKKETLIIFAAFAVTATIAAEQASAQSKNFKLGQWTEIHNSVIKELNRSYVDSLPLDRIMRAGIDAMLDELDPYTVYIPEEENENLQMMLSNTYGGIGAIIYKKKDGNVIINEPYYGSPAQKNGLSCGDEILEIDSLPTKGLETKESSDKMKGKPGTTVVFKVRKVRSGDTLDIPVVRERIHFPDIEYSGMLDDSTGYILQSGFTENVSSELRQKFIDLKKQGMKRLVLDLRGNGGGLMSEAINIVSLFVPKGSLVVSSKGNTEDSKMEYRTTQEPIDTEIPIIVLIDSASASSSEIVAGALQDMDRATIMGVRSYGKGLVQSTRQLPYNGLLKVTIAKYYIPSGRLIQAIDYSHRNPDGTVARIPDSLTTVWHTKAGREVRDGGGITPDIKVEYPEGNRLVYNIVRDNWSFDFANRYAARHDSVAAPEDFVITDTIFNEFKAFIDPARFKYDRTCELILEQLEKASKTEGYLNDEVQAQLDTLKVMLKHDLNHDLDLNRATISEYLASEILQRYYYDRGAIIEALKHDAELDSAAIVLNSPERYKGILRGK